MCFLFLNFGLDSLFRDLELFAAEGFELKADVVRLAFEVGEGAGVERFELAHERFLFGLALGQDLDADEVLGEEVVIGDFLFAIADETLDFGLEGFEPAEVGFDLTE